MAAGLADRVACSRRCWFDRWSMVKKLDKLREHTGIVDEVFRLAPDDGDFRLGRRSPRRCKRINGMRTNHSVQSHGTKGDEAAKG